MGTFHEDLGELHGITVVVRMRAPRVYVGRCHEWTEKGIALHDAGDHEEGRDGRTIADYLKAAARYGVFKRHDRLFLPAGAIASVQRLGDLERG